MTATLTPPQIDTVEPETIDAHSPRGGWRRRVVKVLVLIVGVLVVGNLFILAASAVAQQAAPQSTVDVPAEVASMHNFKAVDAKLWRGGAPSAEEYRSLAAAGVTTIVDLRAEDDLQVPVDVLDEVGLTLVAIPIRDGQTPTTEQVKGFLDAVEASDGSVYLHCGAGVGRTGTMAAAYRVTQGGGGWDAMRANLAVGPPSVEQLAFAASLDAGEVPERPNAVVVALSRTLDAPRRIWKVIEGI